MRAAFRRARFSASGSWLGSVVSGSTAVRMVSGATKRRDVVDVAVGVVAGDAAAEPEDLVDAQIVVKDPLQLLAAHAGVALLHFAQQALLGGEQHSLAIGIDRPAFENKRASRRSRFGLSGCHESSFSAFAALGRAACRRAASRRTWPRR